MDRDATRYDRRVTSPGGQRPLPSSPMSSSSLARLAALSAVVVLAGACGSSSNTDAAGTVPTTGVTTSQAGSSATDAAPPNSDPAGDASGDATSDTIAVPDAPPETAAGALPKPVVKIPATLPTTLVITDLTPGTGEAAKAGDTVIVHYVGVRSADGTEFDNSYDRGQPFPVVLGQGGVIQGWDDGLVGAQAGGRRQLDIPSDLAYGDQDKGDIIKAGDALTFVIDIVSVVPGVDPADAPQGDVEPAVGTTKVAFEDLTPGDGAALAEGDNAVVHLVAYRGDTGKAINSTWESGQSQTIPIDAAQTLPGLVEGLVGMKVGGRRQIIIPFADAFGDAGNEGLGLPAKTDLVLIVDLLATA